MSTWDQLKAKILGADRRLRRIWAGPNRGLKMALRGQDLRIRLGRYEPLVSHAIEALHVPGGGCLDVGCAWGYHTLHMARLGSEGVVGIDADPERARWADKALKAYARDHPAAHCARVDALPSWPSLIKLDVEGAELEILEASRDVLADHGPNLIVETHSLDLQSQCLRVLESCNYQATYYAKATGSRIGRGWIVATDQPNNQFTDPSAVDWFEGHGSWLRCWGGAELPEVVA